MNGRQQYEIDKNLFKREKNWNQRFVLDKIPKFDAYNDVNYLSLGLLKSKIRYEERIKKEESKSKYAGRIYSAHYVKPKSSSKIQKENNLKISNKKQRNPSMRISLDPTVNFNQNFDRQKTLNNFHYQGNLTSQNFAGSYIFNYMPDYKNRNIKPNIIRNIICEEDPEIAEEYELVRDLWEKLGVTANYVNNFDFMLNAKSNNRDAVLELIIGEKKQMKKFRVELLKVISEITKRENKINDLKQFIKTYEQINELIKLKEKKENQKNQEGQEGQENQENEGGEENDENKKLKRPQNIGEVNKELIENDIHDCLKSLRLRTINAVNIIIKFKTTYYHLFNNKINLEFIRKKYGFNDKYLSKIKKDLNFLKNSAINHLYHFSEKGGDPFLLCISDKCGDPADVPKYRQLKISNEILSVVKSFKFALEQEEVFSMIKKKNKLNQSNKYNKTNDNNNYDNYNNNYMYSSANMYNNPNLNSNNNNYIYPNMYNSTNINYNNKNISINNEKKINNSNALNKSNKNEVNEKLISGNFKGNVEDEKLKLKAQNEYKNVFFNTEDNYDDIPNQNLNNQVQKEEIKYELPGMTSKQLYRHLAKYGKIKREFFPPFNKDLIKEEVQKSIIQKIEDRMNKVEKDFRTKMDEKFKNEEKKIKEEEIRLKNEKAKIEKLRIEEEEDRKKKEEKYLKFEEERAKRKKMDRKKKEENERFAKRENDLFLREMQLKFMKEVDERFKKENDRQFKLKKDEIAEAEEKDKKRKKEIERIRHDEYEKIKNGDVLVDLRSEEDRVKFGSDYNSQTNDYNIEKSNTNNKEEEDNKSHSKDASEENDNKTESKKEGGDESSKKKYISNDSESNKDDNTNKNESKKDKSINNSEESKSKNKSSRKNSKNDDEEEEIETQTKKKDDISEDIQSDES